MVKHFPYFSSIHVRFIKCRVLLPLPIGFWSSLPYSSSYGSLYHESGSQNRGCQSDDYDLDLGNLKCQFFEMCNIGPIIIPYFYQLISQISKIEATLEKFGVQYHIMTPPNPRPGRGRPPIMHSTILRDIIDAKHYSLLRGSEGSTNRLIQFAKLYVPYVPPILDQLLDLISLAKINISEPRFESYDPWDMANWPATVL